MRKLTSALMLCMALLMPAKATFAQSSPTEGVLTSTFVSENVMKADMLQMLADFSLYMKNNWNNAQAPNSINESCGFFSAEGSNTAAANEQGVRPNADFSMVCAFLVKYGKPAGVTLPAGVSWADIESMAMKSLIFAYSTHKANKLKVCSGNNYWGSTSTSDSQWESSLWAMSVAYSAFFQWDKLSDAQKEYIHAMLKAECNYELNRNIPTGYAGDTKAEENGWDVDILAATLGLFPDDELAAQWFERMRLFAVNSYSHATDTQKATPIDPNYNGTSAADLFKGKNLYDDYTLQNHNMFHTSYQNVVMQELGEAALALKMFQTGTTGTEKWQSNALFHNNQEVMDEVLNWLATSDGELAMPNGNDWSLFLFDQITSYTTQACFNRDRNALLLENLAYKNIKARQKTTSDGSWLLRPDVAQRRMGVEAHRVMMTYLMHEVMPTADINPISWEEFRENYAKTKYFPAQNIIRSMSKDRFTCFSWNTSLPDYSGVIVPNDIDKAKIMVPFRTHHTGNLLGVYSKADYTVSVPGRYAMYPDAYAMNGVVSFNNIPQAFCLYATSGNAVILIDALKASSATSVSSEQGGMMGISVDEFTNTQRTIYYQGGNVTTDGSSYATWTSPWSNIDNYLGFVVTKHGETVTGAFGDRSNNNSIMTAKIYPSYNGSSSTVGTSMNHIRGFVYYTGVTAEQTAALQSKVKDLTTESSWPEGWHGLLVPDPDGTYYMILANLFADDNTPWENLTVSCPEGAPVFTQVTDIAGDNATATFHSAKNFNIANELKIFIKGGNNLQAVQEDGNSRAAYIKNVGTSTQRTTITIINKNGEAKTSDFTISAGSTIYVDLVNDDYIRSVGGQTFPGNYRNVAYGKSVDANSYDGAHLPFAAIDNDKYTYYKSLNSASSGTEYLTVNLRNQYKINKITVKPQSGLYGPSSVIASTATTEGTFTAIPGVTTETAADGTLTLTFNDVNARFVKLQLLGSTQVSVSEIGIFGEENNEEIQEEEKENLLKKNPSFEEDNTSQLQTITNTADGLRGYTCDNPKEWTVSGTNVTKLIVTADCFTDNNFGKVGTISDGTQAYYLRQGWSTGTTTMTTTSDELPAGNYRLSCDYKSAYANNAASSFVLSCAGKNATSITFTKGSASIMPTMEWSTVSVDFTLDSDQTVQPTVDITWLSGGSCVLFDNFRIEEIEANDQAAVNKANIIANGGDATFLLEDPTCEQSGKWKDATLIGWLAESWRGSGVNGYQERTSNGSIYQYVSNMPAGTYKLVAALRANNGGKITPRLNDTKGTTFTGTGNNNTSVAQINTNGVQMPYNKDRGFSSQNATCRGWQWGSVTAEVAEDGMLTVAFDMEGTSWMSVDDVHLYYISDGTDTFCESVNTTSTEDNWIETSLPITCDIIFANPNTVLKSTKPVYTPSGRMNNNLSGSSMEALVLYDGYTFQCYEPTYSIKSANYMRNMPTYQWGTVILPFKMASNKDIQFYDLRSISADNMYFREVDEAPANTPVTFKKLQTSSTSATFSTQRASCTGTNEEQGQSLTNADGWIAIGNYGSTIHTDAGEKSYYIAQDQFWLSEGGLEIQPFRVYYSVDGTDAPTKMNIVDSEPTGINTVSNKELKQDGIYYNLAGQRVSKPTHGIYITNGKKILVK
ncbi:MAG: discoidin domain-containing protein [Bacteroidaceae bacterium]|nr:discoidin domain-containing protein [Bacteroidaceae bacterium]